MSAPLRLGGFAAGLAVAFTVAFAIGAAADPVNTPSGTDRHAMQEKRAGGGDGGHGDGAGHGGSSAGAPLPGLSVSEGGYTLVPAAAPVRRGREVPFSFRVTGPDGAPVTSYVENHDKELHLIVVRRDLTGFQHVHPVLGPDGTWRVPLDLPAGGTYRVFADFEPVGLGRGLTLGVDVSVPGAFAPEPLPAPAAVVTTDGFDVTVGGVDGLVAGREAEIDFSVARGGRDVTDLQPYLGAFGHLVSLRTGDLAYLHTHPADEAHGDQRGGPTVRFGTEFPTAGTYRLFLDFQVDGTVHTADLVVTVEEDS
jgi:hypothetical protein